MEQGPGRDLHMSWCGRSHIGKMNYLRLSPEELVGVAATSDIDDDGIISQQKSLMNIAAMCKGSNIIITYILEGQDMPLQLDIVDPCGRLVHHIAKSKQAGIDSIIWNAVNAAPGIYFASLRINNATLTRTFTIAK